MLEKNPLNMTRWPFFHWRHPLEWILGRGMRKHFLLTLNLPNYQSRLNSYIHTRHCLTKQVRSKLVLRWIQLAMSHISKTSIGSVMMSVTVNTCTMICVFPRLQKLFVTSINLQKLFVTSINKVSRVLQEWDDRIRSNHNFYPWRENLVKKTAISI